MNLWHTVDELSSIDDVYIYIYTDTRHIIEAQYFGGIDTFTIANNIEISKDQILLWCNRKDLLQKTNFYELLRKIKKTI